MAMFGCKRRNERERMTGVLLATRLLRSAVRWLAHTSYALSGLGIALSAQRNEIVRCEKEDTSEADHGHIATTPGD